MEPSRAVNSVLATPASSFTDLQENIQRIIGGYLVKSPALSMWGITSKALSESFARRCDEIFRDFINEGRKLKHVFASPEDALKFTYIRQLRSINLTEYGPLSDSRLTQFFEGPALSGITTLSLDVYGHLSKITDLKFVGSLQNLNALRIKQAGDFKLPPLLDSLQHLAYFTSLRIYKLWSYRDSNFTGMEKLTQLKTLCLSGIVGNTFPVLLRLPQLTNLTQLELFADEASTLSEIELFDDRYEAPTVSESEQDKIADKLTRLSKLRQLVLQDETAQNVFERILHLLTDLECVNFVSGQQEKREDLRVDRVETTLSKLTKLVRLSVDNNLNAIEGFSQRAHDLRLLRHLDITQGPHLCVQAPENIRKLDAIVAQLTALQSLKIGSHIDNVSCKEQFTSIGQLVNLKCLVIRPFSEMNDDALAALSRLTNLKKMAIRYWGGTRFLRPIFPFLQGLSNFQELEFYLYDISLESLKSLTNLRHLTLLHPIHLAEAPVEADLIHLQSLTNLRRLDIRGLDFDNHAENVVANNDHIFNLTRGIVERLGSNLQELVVSNRFFGHPESQALEGQIKSKKIRLIIKHL